MHKLASALGWKDEKGWNRVALLYFIVATVAVSIVVTVHWPYPHYFIFTKAAARMMTLENPYGISLKGEGGYFSLWYYSPTAAAFFMPFVSLPPRLGQAI